MSDARIISARAGCTGPGYYWRVLTFIQPKTSMLISQVELVMIDFLPLATSISSKVPKSE